MGDYGTEIHEGLLIKKRIPAASATAEGPDKHLVKVHWLLNARSGAGENMVRVLHTGEKKMDFNADDVWNLPGSEFAILDWNVRVWAQVITNHGQRPSFEGDTIEDTRYIFIQGSYRVVDGPGSGTSEPLQGNAYFPKDTRFVTLYPFTGKLYENGGEIDMYLHTEFLL